MSDPIIGTLKEIVRFFGFAVQAKSNRRSAIFERLVQKRLDELQVVHKQFHTLLLPVSVELLEIEREISRGGNQLRKKIEHLSKTLKKIDAIRHEGQPDRIRLYNECLALSKYRLAHMHLPRPLSDEEWDLVKSFIGCISSYFSANPEKGYNHDFGNTFGALVPRVEWWMSGQEIPLESVRAMRADLASLTSQMAAKWGSVANAYGSLVAFVDLNLKLDCEPNEPLLEHSRPATERRAVRDATQEARSQAA